MSKIYRTELPPHTPESSSISRRSVPVLLCLSHLRWNFVFQRPHHLLTRAAKDYRVVFMEEPVEAADGSEAPRLDLRYTAENVVIALPVLPQGLDVDATDAVQRVLLDRLLAQLDAEHNSRLAVLWFYTTMALPFARHLDAATIVYDCMDELSMFRSAPPRLLPLEQQLLEWADLVFTGGRSLYAAKRNRHPSVHLFPSSVDVAHFAPARLGLPEPADQSNIAYPRLGYFGVIDERLDQSLIDGIARLRPNWQIIMIGPTAKVDPADLPRRPNLHWLGGRPYETLTAYLAGWDVGLMPFALNEATRFISPTKTPEFLAAGVPVISTAVQDVVHDYGDAGLVEIASDAAGFVAAAERIMARPRTSWLAQVDKHLATMSWDQTWAAMRALIESPEAIDLELEPLALGRV